MYQEERKLDFTMVYRRVATTAKYSMETANLIGYGDGILACNMPKIMASYVEKYGGGCCFHHSWRLIYELNKVGIAAYWAVVPEPTVERPRDQKCVVVYEIVHGQKLVADVIEDIKAGVSVKDFMGYGCQWLNKDGSIIDNSRYTLQQMANKSDSPLVSGYLKIYPSHERNCSFNDFLKRSEYQIHEIKAKGWG